MKFVVATILTAILAFIAGLPGFSPWWGFALTSFGVAVLIHQRGGRAFLAGFSGVLLLWCGLAGWMDMQNHGILSARIAKVLPLDGNSLYLILVTGVVGGIVSGMAALCGSFIRASGKSR